ncbi:MAG: hypothetical protein H7841_16960 [Magnetospirillum sp. WYHS-4]
MTIDVFQPYLSAIRDEWDKAEEDLKRAEQIGNQPVVPSIKELRYAGRRIIDALHALERKEDAEAMKFIQDALFNCHRARHDAIDAATSAIALKLDFATSQLGYEPVLKAFPKFASLLRDLDAIRERIARSRRNRADRQAIYSAIESVDFPKLVREYGEFTRAEPIMRALAKKQRRETTLSIIFGVVGLVALAVTVVAWLFPR